jgi:hypothetical protein
VPRLVFLNDDFQFSIYKIVVYLEEENPSSKIFVMMNEIWKSSLPIDSITSLTN